LAKTHITRRLRAQANLSLFKGTFRW
jgi:hypothetical protein